MISNTVENYLKALFLLDQRGDKQVATGELATALQVTPGSVTSMMKTLSEAGLVSHQPHYGVKLTPRGRTLAVHVVRRHRIVELFLVEILGMSWSQVHEEAEQLEHAVSEDVINRMDKLLGHPTVDPHGDPIPNAQGTLTIRSLTPLSNCKEGDRGAIARMSDQDSSFLQFAEQNGLLIGTTIQVTSRNELADSITLLSGEQGIVLGLAAAERIEVEIE